MKEEIKFRAMDLRTGVHKFLAHYKAKIKNLEDD